MAARVADLDDIRDRVVARLLGVPMPGVPDPATRSCWSRVTSPPADTATLHPDRVLALVIPR
jgi:phosphoenolpyruvate-protein phosphotransferase (PTS system enzyme I)